MSLSQERGDLVCFKYLDCILCSFLVDSEAGVFKTLQTDFLMKNVLKLYTYNNNVIIVQTYSHPGQNVLVSADPECPPFSWQIPT